MQVARVEQQHDVMIEAVENHMPEVVVIDEIGRIEETLAARTIAERNGTPERLAKLTRDNYRLWGEIAKKNDIKAT